MSSGASDPIAHASHGPSSGAGLLARSLALALDIFGYHLIKACRLACLCTWAGEFEGKSLTALGVRCADFSDVEGIQLNLFRLQSMRPARGQHPRKSANPHWDYLVAAAFALLSSWAVGGGGA